VIANLAAMPGAPVQIGYSRHGWSNILARDRFAGPAEGAPGGAPRDVLYEARVAGTSADYRTPGGVWQQLVNLPAGAGTASFAMDSAGRPACAYLNGGGQLVLYWYDATLSQYDSVTLGAATDPYLYYDYPDGPLAPGNTAGELILVYARAGSVYCRRQVSRFTTEFLYGALPAGFTKITGVCLGTNWRLHVRLGR
jgi:hypothetical protein